MALICAYPMYQLPEVEHFVDSWWQGLRRHLVEQGLSEEIIPKQLINPTDYYAHWRDHRLLLSQTCGYPLTHDLQGQVQYVATHSYHTPFSQGPSYCSLVLVRDTDSAQHLQAMFNTRVAVNSQDSQSGYHSLRGLIAPMAQGEGFFSKVIESSSHRKSMALVAQGEADVCAIDCVTYSLLQVHAPSSLAKLRILTTTQSAPSLPYITSVSTSPEVRVKLQLGLIAASLDPTLQTIRKALMMGPVSILDGPKAYQKILDHANKATALGYRELI
jgi:ABC-type phosphate/phosphonate transport system substrate-binding protein